MWLDGSDEEREDMEDQPEVRGVRCVDEWRCGARRARSRKNEEDKEVKERDRRCRARRMRRMSGP